MSSKHHSKHHSKHQKSKQKVNTSAGSMQSSSTLSMRPSLSNAFSNISITSATTSKHGNFSYSTQLMNKSWIKLQVDSVHHDRKNDEYEIKLSDSFVMAFDFGSKMCSLRIPTDKIEIDTLLNEQLKDENFGNDIDKFLEEIDNQTAVLQLDNIRLQWKQLQLNLTKFKGLSLDTIPSEASTPRNRSHSHSHGHHQRRRTNIKPCHNSVEECPQIQRIIFILRYYALFINYKQREQLYDDEEMKKYPSSMTHIIDILENYDKIELLNDYIHIKKSHGNDEYELCSHIKGKIPQCIDNKTCIHCMRNTENNEIYRNLSTKQRRDLYLINNMKDGSIEEIAEINIQRYLDTMHSSLIHQMLSDNINYKFSTHLLAADSDSHDDGDNDQDQDEKQQYKMNGGYDISTVATPSISVIHQMDALGSEYDLSVISNDDNYFYNINDYSYKFGDRFSYWNSKMIDYIKPKYNDLKTELLSNCIETISSDDYNMIYQRAMDFLQCDSGKNMSCKRQFSWMYKSVKYGQKITVDHMIAIIIHTNYISLRDKLINTGCKRINDSESLDELKNRHCEIVNFCRLLKEAIFCFGDSFSDRSKLYHGIDCKLMFNAVDFSFNIPISTTIKYSIAPHTSSNGICLKFGKSILPNQKNYYLDVSDLSQFPNEKERIVFGGEPLGFLDIIYNGQSHSEHVMSLRLYQQIIEGNWFSDNKDLMKIKYQRRIIKLMNSTINTVENKNYMMGMFKNLATLKLKENTMWINKKEIELCLPEFKQLFFDKFQNYLIKQYSLNVKYCDILEMNLSKQQIEISSFKKSIYSNLYTYHLNETEKVSFIFRCFKKFDEVRKENMFRGFIAIKYLPKSNIINRIEMRYGLHFPQKTKLSKWDQCILSPNNLYKGSSLFSLSEIKNIHQLQIKICFQIKKVE